MLQLLGTGRTFCIDYYIAIFWYDNKMAVKEYSSWVNSFTNHPPDTHLSTSNYCFILGSPPALKNQIKMQNLLP